MSKRCPKSSVTSPTNDTTSNVAFNGGMPGKKSVEEIDKVNMPKRNPKAIGR